MGLKEQLAEYPKPFRAILAVATCRDSMMFGDLYWPPIDPEVELQRLTEGRNAGVIFETSSRVVVIEEHGGEFRYYAGGWRSQEDRIHLEQDRIWAEGHEMGIVQSPQDAVEFTERFLARREALQDIATPRLTRYQEGTDKNWLASHCI